MTVLYTLILALSLPLLTSACTPTFRDLPEGTRLDFPSDNNSAVVAQEFVTVAPLSDTAIPEVDYRIGPGDVLFVNINGRPELMPANNDKVSGSRVDGSGRVTIPLVGQVAVAGLTLPEAQEAVRAAVKTFFREPWVVIEMAEFRSQPLYLLGSFKAPGVYYLDRPQTVLQGISLAGGFDGTANLRGARLSRGGKVQPVDLFGLLTGGEQRQNVWLKAGDVIYLPDKSLQQVFVFGSVKKSGAVPMLNGQLNLAQAIAAAELRETGYDLKHIRIIRSHSPTRGELLVVNFETIMHGKALPFILQEGDIVYVPRSEMGSWNDTIAEILPSLQAVSTALQPFVSIKYLSD